VKFNIRVLFVLFLFVAAAIYLKSDYAEAYYNWGVSKNSLGDYKEAIEDYTKAIQLKSDYAEAYNNRGVSKKNLGD
jgi:tetratricopeptide (TPR) repeat protein